MAAWRRSLQAPLPCQMCEDTTEITWKCLTCEFFICTKCKNIHQKVKSSDEHIIVDIKEFINHSDSKGKPVFINIKCMIHEEQSLCLYCSDCHQGICPTCITKIHSKHTLIELSDGYRISEEKIKNENGRLDEHSLRLDEGLSALTVIKSNEKTKQEKLKQEILKQEKVCTDAFKKYTHKLLNEIDEKWLNLDASIEEEETKVSKIISDLDDKKDIFRNAVNSNNAWEIFRIVQHELCCVPRDPPSVNTSFKQLPVFGLGSITEASIKLMFGSLQDKVTTHKELRIVQQYKTDRPCVDNIACCNDRSLWINDFKNDTLQHVTISDGTVQIIRLIKHDVAAISLTNSGDLLLSTRNPKLQIIQQISGKLQKSKYSVAPLITTGVHVTKENKVLVGARESGPAFPADGKYGPRKLIVMNDKGEHETEHQYDNKNKALFTNVYRITTDRDNNIYVIDRISDNFSGRVVVLGWKGDVRGVYGSHTTVHKTDNPFMPMDLKTIESNTAIVIDWPNLLHFLDNRGQYLTFYNTKDLGFELPLSLGTDDKGHVYIGCYASKGQVDEAKIVVLRLH